MPRCACVCGSASDSSTASAVSSPPARARGWPRGGRSLGASSGTAPTGYGRGSGHLRAWGTRRDEARGQGYAPRTEHRGSRLGRPGGGKGGRGLQPGQGRRSGRTAAQGWCWVPDLALWPSPLGAGPGLAAFSFWILRFLTRLPAESRPSDPRAPGIVPGRQGGRPRRAADLSAHFPRSPVWRSKSVPQRALGAGAHLPQAKDCGGGGSGPLEKGAVGRIARRCVLELEMNLELATCERSAGQKRQEAGPPGTWECRGLEGRVKKPGP